MVWNVYKHKNINVLQKKYFIENIRKAKKVKESQSKINKIVEK